MGWWFSRKSPNRRLKPPGELATRAARRQALSARWRTASLALGVAMSAVIVLLTIWRGGDWLIRRMVYDNEAFAIRSIDIQTDGVLPLEQLRQWAGVKPGDNLLTVDLPQIKRHLELAPLIRKVSVERVLPNTLKLRVGEREPLVQARVLTPKPDDSGYEVAIYYLDDEGYVLRPLDNPPRGSGSTGEENYAVLTGLGRADLRPGRQAESPQVFTALRLLEAFGQSAMLGVADLARIDVSTPEVLQVTTSLGSEITFGLENLESQLRRWRAVYDYGLKQGKQIASLDLSITNNLPVLWLETNEVPVAKPKPIKTSPSRNKHV
jgi:cell division septal protein FtsQ